MTEVKQYIKTQLEKLAAQFPLITIRYAWNELAETHIVQLTPENEYYSNALLDDAWMEIVVEMNEHFPLESISFVSEDAQLLSTTPEFQFNIRGTDRGMEAVLHEVHRQFRKYRSNFTMEFTTDLMQTKQITVSDTGIVIFSGDVPQVVQDPGDYSYAMAA